MSYPSGAQGGYPGQSPQPGGPAFGQPPQRPNPLAGLGLPSLLALVVLVLALVSYFCSFTSDAGGVGTQVMLLLTGGLLAGMHVLPNTPKVLPFATLLSSVGGLSVLAGVVQASGGTVPTIDIIILIFGVLQFLVSVAALLLDIGIIKLAPKAAVPFAPPGGFPQQQPGNFPPGQPTQPAHPGQYGGQPAPPPHQSTQFMQQPGQLSQQPGTPPGGFGGSNSGQE